MNIFAALPGFHGFVKDCMKLGRKSGLGVHEKLGKWVGIALARHYIYV